MSAMQEVMTEFKAEIASEIESMSKIYKVCEHLYFSSNIVANNAKILQQYNIEYILKLFPDCRPNCARMSNIKYLVIPLEDNCNFDLTPYFTQCYDFIREAIDNKKKHFNSLSSRKMPKRDNGHLLFDAE